MRILIVEDEMLVALSMGDTLSEAGHIVVGCAREEGMAMQLADSARPQLALVDLKLARGESGAVVAWRLRQKFGIATVFVSGSPRDCATVGFQSGALGCLRKPFKPDELIDAVDTAAAIIRRQDPTRIPSNMELYFTT